MFTFYSQICRISGLIRNLIFSIFDVFKRVKLVDTLEEVTADENGPAQRKSMFLAKPVKRIENNFKNQKLLMNY